MVAITPPPPSPNILDSLMHVCMHTILSPDIMMLYQCKKCHVILTQNVTIVTVTMVTTAIVTHFL